MKNLSMAIAGMAIFLFPSFNFAQSWEPNKPFNETYAYGCNPEEVGYGENPSCGVVIALSGLKLRAKPSFDAKTLAVIPFGSTIERTEKGYDLRPAYGADMPMTPDSISGYWQEISWQGKKGFAFSAFIGEAIYRMDQDGYLLFENGGMCWNDCYASLNYYYYGVFANHDSSRWDLKKIKPSFVYQNYDFAGTSLISNTKQRPAFIIATKKVLNEGLLLSEKTNQIVFVQDYQRQVISNPKKVNIPHSQFYLSVSSTPNDEKGIQYTLLLTEKSSGRMQTLVTEIYVTKIELVWSGDLDSDGIMDFMLSYQNDHSFACQLFLSGFAKGKQLLKPIKIYWYGDCC